MPGGFESGLPTINVPPILSCVAEGGVVGTIKGLTGSELPITRVIDPPLLPVRVTLAPLFIVTSVPGLATTSYTTGEKESPILSSTTSPVEERDPEAEIITEPPELP